MPTEEVWNAFQLIEKNNLGISDQQMIAFMHASGFDLKISRGMLHLYRTNKSTSTANANEKIIKDFLFATNLGRAIRNPTPPNNSGYYGLIETISQRKDDAAQYQGMYFMLHGSYMYPREFAVHLLELEYNEEGVLEIFSTILDRKSVYKDVQLSSTGVAAIIDGMPQMLMYGGANRVGFSLLGARHVNRDDKQQISTINGTLCGVSKNHEWFVRKVSLVSLLNKRSRELLDEEEYTLLRDRYIASTGVYTRNQLNGVQDARIIRSFHALSRFYKETSADMKDPMASFKPS